MIEFTKDEQKALKVVANYKEDGIFGKLKKIDRILWIGFIVCTILGIYLQYKNISKGSLVAFKWMRVFASLALLNFFTNFCTIIQKQQKRISQIEEQDKS